MALEDVAESMEGKGWLGVLVGAAILAPALPTVAKKLRPAAKGAVKGYLTMKDKMGEWFAETGEQWQDLIAEAKAEHTQEASGAEMMPLTTMESGAGEEGGMAPPAEATAQPNNTPENESKGRSRVRKDKESAPQPA